MELNEERLDYVKYRLEKAKDDLESSKELLVVGKYRSSLNRSYYAIFHSMRSLLATEHKDFRHHSGVISYFNQYYVKTGIFEKEFAKIVSGASLQREKADYTDFFLATKEEAEQQYQNAEKFYNRIEEYLYQQIPQLNNR